MSLFRVSLIMLALAAASPAFAQNSTANPGAPNASVATNQPPPVIERDRGHTDWGWLGLLGLAGLAGLMPRKRHVAERATLNDTSGTIRR
jgi:hypothetical protein